jgi:hypothetical protein
VTFGHWYPSLKSNDKFRLIFFFTFCAFFPSFISNTSIVSINFRANLDTQNAGNGISGFKFQKCSGGVHLHTRDHCYPPLISNDKLWLIFFLNFCAFFPSFISNTIIVSINLGSNAPDPPIHAWYVGHTRGLQPLLSPCNILSHRKVPFQKMPPPPMGKFLKKALIRSVSRDYIAFFSTTQNVRSLEDKWSRPP